MTDGWYEFGRNDGHLVPVLIRIESEVPTSGDDVTRKVARFAMEHSGFWWRRVNVPDILPIVLGCDHYHWTVELPPPPPRKWR